MIEIPVTFNSDEKGYFDRECPNTNCLYTFKIHMDDWKKKVSDEQVVYTANKHIYFSSQQYQEVQ